jgi:hypothetical protein
VTGRPDALPVAGWRWPVHQYTTSTELLPHRRGNAAVADYCRSRILITGPPSRLLGTRGTVMGAELKRCLAVRFRVPAQPVDATQALSLSAGISIARSRVAV